MSARIEGILFDKDGTLFDFAASWGGWLRRLLKDLSEGDATLGARLAKAVGYAPDSGTFLPGSPIIAETTATNASILLRHLPNWDHPRLVAHMDGLAAEITQVPILPLAPLLENLRGRGLALGVATNDGEAPARSHLEKAGVLGMFDFVAGADSGHGGKPEPGALLAFAQALGLEPGSVAMVGDSAHDLMAGRAAGMVCVGVSRGANDPEALPPLADVVLNDIGELPEWLDSRG
ncbi:HAD family hydrolase [Oceaniglobus trochenteri]|uniref:HAD family hydrolase n=1 Tax=Oceaniglobus trochenteri TaxID=2763260 RepID=UPI001CFF9882|nr:HAD family hydrolase [Oceaniglobus trochenteri]